MVALLKSDNRRDDEDALPIDTVICGDALSVLKTLPGNSVHAVVTDPPAGIAFMSKGWDSDKGGRDHWIAWLAEIMREVLRCLKPGGHAFVWALPRTSHWTAMALEEAGFEIREKFYHLFGSGFPKSQDISKAIDRMAGVEREVVGPKLAPDGKATIDRRPNNFVGEHEGWDRPWKHNREAVERQAQITKPATPEAEQWAGWGSATKPAAEEWILARKPLDGTLAQNVLRHGVGGLNIDASRISTQDDIGRMNKPGDNGWKNSSGGPSRATYDTVAASGRWPANTLLSHTIECRQVGMKRVKGNGPSPQGLRNTEDIYDAGFVKNSPISYRDSEGQEAVEAWECPEFCPVRVLDEQSGNRKSGARKGAREHISNTGYGSLQLGGACEASEGGASRYFQQFSPTLEDMPPFTYCAKASRRERNEGCEGLATGKPDAHNLSSNACGRCGLRVKANGSGEKCECGPLRETVKLPATANDHPTCKPVALLRYLTRLCCPPGGIVLDPFFGSGTTGVACTHEGFHYIGIEQDEHYCDIARARIAHASHQQSSASPSHWLSTLHERID